MASLSKDYSVIKEASSVFRRLIGTCSQQLPDGWVQRAQDVKFIRAERMADTPVFPCPLKEQEAISAIRALEGMAVAALSDLGSEQNQKAIQINISKAALFLMSAYVVTLDGLGKGNPDLKNRIPDTDINQAQSILYRRLSANLYQTKVPGEYYHIHGSLDATKTLNMLGLEAFRPDLTSYEECLKVIGDAVSQFDTTQLEDMNRKLRQAGAPVLKRDQFLATRHAETITDQPPFTVEPLERSTPAAPLPNTPGSGSGHHQVLQGVRVIELCRVLAGPVIGRSLAAHGASVLKVTCNKLPDVPFFQLDVNTGKRTTSLDLRDEADRAKFEGLLQTADVIINGYRPRALERLGYGLEALAKMGQDRGRGFVYVSEDCFGGSDVGGEAAWSQRPGWQQIADCVTGVAWAQGQFMCLDEPVVPPFPMSDYGTGALGCVAALIGLYRRATEGGSWTCRTSLCQYDHWVMGLGLYEPAVQEMLREQHTKEFFGLRHNDSVDEVSRRALMSMKHVHAGLFGEEMMMSRSSKAWGGVVSWPREALTVEGLAIGYLRTGRPNGYDEPSWDGWEVDPDLLV